MFWMVLQILAVWISLQLFGIIRTSLWLIPSLFHPLLMLVGSGSLVSFIAITSLLSRYEGGFDFRNSTKERWILYFFMSGILTWTLFYPCDFWLFGFGAGFPWLFIQVSRVVRFPIPEVFIIPKYWKFLAPLIWAAFCLGKLLYAK